eukprot:461945-Lingulodinium_polyedra.AAC.1
MPTLRELGHTGVCIQHYTFDRALQGALYKLFSQHHSIQEKQATARSSSAKVQHLEPNLNWVVCNGCSNHDAHNALKWSLHGFFQNTDLLKD